MSAAGPDSTAASIRPPVLVLDRVVARDQAGLRGRPRGRLDHVSLALGAGVHALLGGPEDGTLAFSEIAGGARRPTRGTVRIAGRDPARFSAMRGRIGVLAAEPKLPAGSTVADAVRLGLRARGEAGLGIDALLDPLGLSPLHARRVRSLSLGEARAVELALALSTPAPIFVTLHEPLSDVAVPNLDFVRHRLRELAAAGACVVVTTSSPADARAVADRVLVLHRGAVAREVGSAGIGLDLGRGAELVIWMRASGPDGDASLRAMAAGIAASPAVRGVGWDAPPGGEGVPAVLRVHASDAQAAARAIADAAVEIDVIVDAIAPAAPALAEVRAATEAMLRALAARRAVPAGPPPPVYPQGGA